MCGVIYACSGQTKRMLSSDEFWKGAMISAVISGIIAAVLLKLWEKKGRALGKTGQGNKSKKLPTEHDERF